MKPLYITSRIEVRTPMESKCLPAQVGLSYPLEGFARSPRPMEHPYSPSTTVELGVSPLEPSNGSTLAITPRPV